MQVSLIESWAVCDKFGEAKNFLTDPIYLSI